MKRAKTYLLLLAGIVLLAGCQKDPRFGDDQNLIRFSAAALPETKTAYSGATYTEGTGVNARTFERINWIEGDRIRIWSPQASDRYHSSKHYADYKVSKVLTPDGRYSRAEIINAGIQTDLLGNQVGVSNPAAQENDNVNGLVWGAAGTYTFYGIYPAAASLTDAQITDGAAGKLHGTIDSDQGTGDLEVNMPKYGYLTAATQVTTTTPITQANQTKFVTLEFDPAFTAFEISFESETAPMKVTKVELLSTSTDMAGKFAVQYTATTSGGTTTITKAFQFAESGTKSVFVDLGTDGVTVSPGSAKSVTLFALPKDQTDLTLRFTVVVDGQEDTRSLKLAYGKDYTDDAGVSHTNGDPIVFAACTKHRITNIQMPNNLWRTVIELDGVVLPWDEESSSTSFTEQIQCTGLSFNTSAIEMTLAYQQAHPDDGTNHYRYDSPIGDGRWQVRTLNQDDGYESFTVTFRPIAPRGGYWGLDTHGNRFFKVEMLKEVIPGEGPTAIPLPEKNQIMNETVTLLVTPVWSEIAVASSDEEIGLYMDCYFYTNVDSDPLNANTEFQDIHRNGSYSYWLLTVAR